jgi:prepilin-type processing-associated H-X9-DG protein
MTFIEVVMVVAVILLLAAVVLPWLRGNQQRQRRITCTSNLVQIGVACRTWALGHSDLYPAVASGSLGGAQKDVASGEAFRWFQVMSNELASPRVLVCPADDRVRATSFSTGLSNRNLSYFVGLDAVDTNPQMFLAGDRNLTNGLAPTNGILVLITNRPTGWTHAIHRFQGNVALADGSVQQFSTPRLRTAIPSNGTPERLAMP